MALAFAREGADVLLTHLPEEEHEARATVRLVEQAGRKAVPVLCDIRDEKQCRSLIERAVSEFGRIDVLVNNAAYQMSQPDGISAISTEQFDRVMRTNLYGMFWLQDRPAAHSGRRVDHQHYLGPGVQAEPASPRLRDDQGGDRHLHPGPGPDAGLRRHPRQRSRPRSGLDPLIPATLPDTAEFGKQSPLGRPAQPAEMAPAYVFLASANASFITGEIMNATGGTPLP